MFPSKFLQFPSILTHFHAANEKIQNGGRDLAISRGLVWVKFCHRCCIVCWMWTTQSLDVGFLWYHIISCVIRVNGTSYPVFFLRLFPFLLNVYQGSIRNMHFKLQHGPWCISNTKQPKGNYTWLTLYHCLRHWILWTLQPSETGHA